MKVFSLQSQFAKIGVVDCFFKCKYSILKERLQGTQKFKETILQKEHNNFLIASPQREIYKLFEKEFKVIVIMKLSELQESQTAQ